MAVVNKPWVPIRTDLEDDPRVTAIARACDASLAKVPKEYRKHVLCWGLKRVWSYFVTHSVEGAIGGLTATDIDDIAGVAGLAAAMSTKPGRSDELPWLAIDDAGATIPDFSKWHWKTLRRQAGAAERQAEHKERRVTRALPARYQSVAEVLPGALPKCDSGVTGALPGNDSERYQSVTPVYTRTTTQTDTEIELNAHLTPERIAEEKQDPWRCTQRVLKEMGVDHMHAARLSARPRITPAVAYKLYADCAKVKPENPTGWAIARLREMKLIPMDATK